MLQIEANIGKDSEHYAKITVSSISKIVDNLSELPMSGRIVPEYKDVYIREKFYKSYRIIYEIFPDRIEILSVYHMARLLPELFELSQQSSNN